MWKYVLRRSITGRYSGLSDLSAASAPAFNEKRAIE